MKFPHGTTKRRIKNMSEEELKSKFDNISNNVYITIMIKKHKPIGLQSSELLTDPQLK